VPRGKPCFARDDFGRLNVTGLAIDQERWYLLDAQANRIRLLRPPR